MRYDFDRIVDRTHTNSVKWDCCEDLLGVKDVLPLWVADMDFRSPPEVVEALGHAARHGIFGYSSPGDSYYQAIEGWAKRRYSWEVRREWLSYTPGVITGLNIAVQTFTQPGDKIIVQPPVYPPFFASVETNGRRLVYNHLVDSGNGYEIDFDQLEDCIDDRTKMLVFCNPHNPVGRAFTRQELTRLGELVLRHNLLLFSDEIHADILYQNRRHIPAASLDPELAKRTITGMAPSKTFNIAGLKASVIVVSNQRLKQDFDYAQDKTFGLYNANLFAIRGLEAAYTHGEDWLEQLLPYLERNVDLAMRYFQEELPEVRPTRPEGTFLLWLDFGALGLRQGDLVARLYQRGQVALNDGAAFRPRREGFMRLNLGCPRSVLAEGLERIKKAVRS